jgi:hypothetical protein
VEPGERGKRREVRLLHRILDLRLVAQKRSDRPIDAAVVAPEEDLERRDVPGADAVHDFIVRERGHRIQKTRHAGKSDTKPVTFARRLRPMMIRRRE